MSVSRLKCISLNGPVSVGGGGKGLQIVRWKSFLRKSGFFAVRLVTHCCSLGLCRWYLVMSLSVASQRCLAFVHGMVEMWMRIAVYVVV